MSKREKVLLIILIIVIILATVYFVIYERLLKASADTSHSKIAPGAAKVVASNITTLEASDRKSHSATLNGSNAISASDREFNFANPTGPANDPCRTVSGKNGREISSLTSGTGAYSAPVGELSQGTNYCYQAYIPSQSLKGEWKLLQTLPEITVSTGGLTTDMRQSMTPSCSIHLIPDSAITGGGFYYTKSLKMPSSYPLPPQGLKPIPDPNAKVDFPKIYNSSAPYVGFMFKIGSLSSGTYYYLAYATDSKGVTYYGDWKQAVVK